jgi:hypothetical protein
LRNANQFPISGEGKPLSATIDLKRIFLRVLIASLVATAALAIGFLLLADFDERTWKVIGTTALLSGFSLLALPGAALLDQGRALALGWANVLLAAVGLTYSLVLLWTEADSGWKPLVALVGFTGAAAQASGTTARRRTDDPPSVMLLYLAGLAGGAILALLISNAAWQEVEDSGYYRLVGALAVAEVLVVLLQPILRRTGSSRAPAPAAATDGFSFTVTLDDGREVPYRDEARDFAAAVASAISELERSGATVLRVERT